MDSNELDLVRTSVQHLVAHCTPATFATDLVNMGWADLYDAEAAAAVTVLADEVGHAAAAAPLLGVVLAQALGLTGTVVLPPLARGTTPAWPGVAAGSDLAVNGLLEPGSDGDTLFVPTYGRLTFFNDTMARYEQLFNDNGTVYDSFDLIRGPPPYGTPF